ncbi:uncharacterized protein EHS24_006930 [Apiotrichum porosum]|uniref:Uncharacterized protein n=1 Tax=Apiotrichum porosum TaxID=105984 RepID=A0A427XWL4_9TREE|nr:uncharacterized protein EHS24_006930 [Apiotrichum porosum]RSH83259.1 hypothetical protein EHS24_006930 [Apiotrichum porosum]
MYPGHLPVLGLHQHAPGVIPRGVMNHPHTRHYEHYPAKYRPPECPATQQMRTTFTIKWVPNTQQWAQLERRLRMAMISNGYPVFEIRNEVKHGGKTLIHLMTPTEYCGKFESDINELLYELFTSWGMRWSGREIKIQTYAYE